MYPDVENLKDLIARAEVGDIKGAREGLREFTRRRPGRLLAWKWLADVAESAKERTAAIRRAQLLAPGDPWIIEAKKHRRPPKIRPPKLEQRLPTKPFLGPRTSSALPKERGPAVTPSGQLRGAEVPLSTQAPGSPPISQHAEPAFEAHGPDTGVLADSDALVSHLGDVPLGASPVSTTVKPDLARGSAALPPSGPDQLKAGAREGGWLIWVAVGLTVLGLVLIAAAWYLGAF